MRVTDIFEILDMAKRARAQGRTLNPCFVSAPGLGKSEIVQQWARKEGYGLKDVRAALLEAPDLIGFPTVIKGENGRERTVHATPDFWPESGNGILFIDEVNRGTTSVMNCFMQLLTDRKVKDYVLPEGWIIVAAINPENEMNDVNSMDSALRDRLEFFNIEYNKKIHLEYMENTNYDPTIQLWVQSGTWKYVPPEDVSPTVKGAKYISPRTLSKLNNAIAAGIPERLELEVYNNLLGDLMGKSFYQFKNNEQPVLFEDLINNQKKALARLSIFCDPKNYKTGHISITAQSLVNNEKELTNDLLNEVCVTIGAEQAIGLIREIEFKRSVDSGSLFDTMVKTYPKFAKYCKSLKVS